MRFAVVNVVLSGALVLAGCATQPPVERVESKGRVTGQNVRLAVPHYPVTDPQLERDLVGYLEAPVTAGNRIDTFVNGDQIFPAMLQAIRSARRSINLETFVYWNGDVGQAIARALADRARDGVQVRVLLDWVGNRPMDPKLVEMMVQAGVKVQKFTPTVMAGGLEHRMNQKLLIVDGVVGFTGGMGIAAGWAGTLPAASAQWRDTHYRVLGPAVAQMQSAFIDSWSVAGDQPMTGDDFFPSLRPWGERRAQLFNSVGANGDRRVKLMYLLAIAAARQSISLQSAYFVPDADTVTALVEARKRGVQVRIVVPGQQLENPTAVMASRSAAWVPLLAAGVEIYEYGPAMLHSKLFVVDRYFTSVGSAHFDNQAKRASDEANLNVFDADFGHEQERLFEHDLQKARRVQLSQGRTQPVMERVQDGAASLRSSKL